MIEVTLTHGEIIVASALGLAREQEALRLGMVDPRAINEGVRYGHWSAHVEGCLGELACCKALGVFFPATINTGKSIADIPPNLEIKTRPDSGTRPHDRKLIIRDNDIDSRIFVLVLGAAPTYRIMGWIKCAEAKKHDDWKFDPNGQGEAWWVPVEALKPLDIVATRNFILAYHDAQAAK
jgi:hypothetical protein